MKTSFLQINENQEQKIKMKKLRNLGGRRREVTKKGGYLIGGREEKTC